MRYVNDPRPEHYHVEKFTPETMTWQTIATFVHAEGGNDYTSKLEDALDTAVVYCPSEDCGEVERLAALRRIRDERR